MSRMIDWAKKNRYRILSYFMLLFVFIFLMIFMDIKMEALLDSDEASELLLSKILASEHRIITDSWFYSTELRVLNTQLIYSLLFLFTQNWHYVRLIAFGILYALLVITYILLLNAYKLQKYAPLSACILLLPFSTEYFAFVLKGAYYIPHIVISFTALYLIEKANKSDERRKICYFSLNTLLALLAGMGGARQLVVFYLPLLVGFVLELLFAFVDVSENQKRTWQMIRDFLKKDRTISILSCFVGATIGYVLNTKVLTRHFLFKSWDTLSFQNIRVESLSQILNGFFVSFGYVSEEIGIVAVLSNAISFFWILLTILSIIEGIRNRKKEDKTYYQFSLLILSQFGIFILLYVFTNLMYNDRYNLPVIIMSIPLIIFYLKEKISKQRQLCVVMMFLACLVGIKAGIVYCDYYAQDITREYRQMLSILDEKGIRNGYATYWNANVLTELSNGNVEVWNWFNIGKGFEKDDRLQVQINPSDMQTLKEYDQMFHWLQPVNHVKENPKGPIFLLFFKEEYENCNWMDRLEQNHNVYETDNMIMFLYDSYQELYNSFWKYEYQFKYGENMTNGKDIDGKRSLYPQGSTYGQKFDLYRGVYELKIRGKRLKLATVKAYGNNRAREVCMRRLKYDNKQLVYLIEADETIPNFEIIISNKSKKRFSLSSMKIRRVMKYNARRLK